MRAPELSCSGRQLTGCVYYTRHWSVLPVGHWSAAVTLNTANAVIVESVF
jgi:hypothetical protein